MHHLGIQLTSIQAGRVEAHVHFHEHLRQQLGFLHGGAISTLSDIVMGFATYSLLPEGKNCVTAELRVSYVRPGNGTHFTAIGSVLKPGKGMHFCEAEVFSWINNEPTLIAKASAIMAVIS